MATDDIQQTSHLKPNAQEDGPEIHPIDDALEYCKAYARQKPETAALVCIGIGFVLGWKLKPW